MAKKFIFLVFLLGLLIRLAHPLNRTFEYDQNYLAESAQSILSGKLTLIGPQASAASFFTGPLINYLSAFSYLLSSGHPIANTLIPVIIFAIGFWLVKLISKSSTYLVIYAFSPLLIALDRITWNPNLSFLSASLVFLALASPKHRYAKLAAFLGAFLAYQAHFSGFLMLVIALTLAFFTAKKLLLPLAIGLAASLAPLLIFDLRHSWLNLKGMLGFLQNPVTGDTINANFWGQQPLTQLHSSLENIGKLIAYTTHPYLVLGLSLGLLTIYLVSRKKNLLVPVWVLGFTLFYSLYRGNVPEYYYLMQLPAIAYALSDLLHRFPKFKPYALIFILACAANAMVATNNNDFNLGNKIKSIRYIQNRYPNQAVNLKLDMYYQELFGWPYLLSYTKLSQDTDSAIEAHIVFPVNIAVLQTTVLETQFGPIGVWFKEN